MNKLVPLLLLLTFFTDFNKNESQFIARQGQVTFFSYTSVENIEAQNNQVLSILDLKKQEIAVSMLMRAFVFKKDLMYEHFNESYIESDMYPKATFLGKIINFDDTKASQTKMIKGTLTIHGEAKEITIKTVIIKKNNKYSLEGDFNVLVKDFDIKIPPILSANIAKTISLKFKFLYQSYEE